MAPTRPDAPLTEPELAAWRGMLRVHHDVVARLDAELEREQGLPLSSYEVLISLADAPGGRLRMGELAGVLLLSRSGLTRLVDRLEREGLVERERCEDDQRGYFAVITKAGRKKLETARPAHWAGVREHFLDRLGAEDLDILARAWRKVSPDVAVGWREPDEEEARNR
jgi:DNA-binding MarR family transcriptional regulator